MLCFTTVASIYSIVYVLAHIIKDYNVKIVIDKIIF